MNEFNGKKLYCDESQLDFGGNMNLQLISILPNKMSGFVVVVVTVNLRLNSGKIRFTLESEQYCVKFVLLLFVEINVLINGKITLQKSTMDDKVSAPPQPIQWCQTKSQAIRP